MERMMRMRKASCALVVLVVIGLLSLATAGAEPSPKRTPLTNESRATLPGCDELRLSADDMSAAFKKYAVEAEDAPVGEAAFDAIGDELGCRWPWSAEDSRRGMMQMLEKSGGTGVKR